MAVISATRWSVARREVGRVMVASAEREDTTVPVMMSDGND